MQTPYQIFSGEILNILKDGAKAHKEIANELKRIFPEYCDDSIPCPHVNDNSGHPEWDHLARNAEQGLKRKGIIIYNRTIKKWVLV
jgi:hypothetical protein